MNYNYIIYKNISKTWYAAYRVPFGEDYFTYGWVTGKTRKSAYETLLKESRKIYSRRQQHIQEMRGKFRFNSGRAHNVFVINNPRKKSYISRWEHNQYIKSNRKLFTELDKYESL